MQVLACPELIDPLTLDCPVPWVVQSLDSYPITLNQAPELMGMALLVFVTAFAGRLIRKQFLN